MRDCCWSRSKPSRNKEQVASCAGTRFSQGSRCSAPSPRGNLNTSTTDLHSDLRRGRSVLGVSTTRNGIIPLPSLSIQHQQLRRPPAVPVVRGAHSQSRWCVRSPPSCACKAKFATAREAARAPSKPRTDRIAKTLSIPSRSIIIITVQIL